MAVNNKCVVCGTKLRLGEFAYNQDTCWGCFKDKCKDMWRHFDDPEEMELFNHLVAVLAECHGYEW